MTGSEWAQVASTTFAALAAGGAWMTVVRAGRDRKNASLPDLFVDVVHDRDTNQVRATVINYGGPAREVKVGGVQGAYGYFGLIGPTSYWRPGEMRTILLSVPLGASETNQTFVEGRDVRMRYLFATTSGGNQKRWKLRQARKMSADDIYTHFFPGVPGPLDVPHAQTGYSTIDRVL